MFKKTLLGVVALALTTLFAEEVGAQAVDNRGIDSINFSRGTTGGNLDVNIYYFTAAEDANEVGRRFDTQLEIRVNGTLVATITDSVLYAPESTTTEGAKAAGPLCATFPCEGKICHSFYQNQFSGGWLRFPGRCFDPIYCICKKGWAIRAPDFGRTLIAGDIVKVDLTAVSGSVSEVNTSDNSYSRVVFPSVPTSTKWGRIVLAFLLAGTAAGFVVWRKRAMVKGGDLA